MSQDPAWLNDGSHSGYTESRRLNFWRYRLRVKRCDGSYTIHLLFHMYNPSHHFTHNLPEQQKFNRFNLQCIGETKWRLRDRFNEHRRSVDKTNVIFKHTTVAEHFLSRPNHCYTDMQLILLELINSSRNSIRKARESILINSAGTLDPTVWIDVMNRKACNIRRPVLSVLYLVCFVRHFRHSF